jgi:DNA-binding response OmpR family regulator
MSKVLLVEDDPTMFSLLSTLLSMEGFDVYRAEEDSEPGIIHAVRQSNPDLVLMDVNLRQANGLDILRRLRADVSSPKVRVIISSGMDYTVECRQAGADCFMLKPYMPDDLVQEIRDLLAQSV